MNHLGLKILTDFMQHEITDFLSPPWHCKRLDAFALLVEKTAPTRQEDLPALVSNIKSGRKAEDLLFQVLLDWGVDITLPIANEIVEGKTIFLVDGDVLAACFDVGVNETLVKHIASQKPLRAVFQDGGFEDNDIKINVEI